MRFVQHRGLLVLSAAGDDPLKQCCHGLICVRMACTTNSVLLYGGWRAHVSGIHVPHGAVPDTRGAFLADTLVVSAVILPLLLGREVESI